MGDLTDLYQAILCGDSSQAEGSARRALAAEVDPAHLLTAGVISAMQEARRRFQAHEYYVPEMLIACRAMKAAMNEIRPHLAAGGLNFNARLSVISLAFRAEDVTGGLVADLLEGAGFEVTRSSLAVPEANRAEQWRIAEAAAVVLVVPTVALVRDSACLHMPARETAEWLCQNRVRHGCKTILVGGDSTHAGAFGLDAHVADFADVVPSVEWLTQHAGFA